MKVQAKMTVDFLRSPGNMETALAALKEHFKHEETLMVSVHCCITRSEYEQWKNDERMRLGGATVDMEITTERKTERKKK